MQQTSTASRRACCSYRDDITRSSSWTAPRISDSPAARRLADLTKSRSPRRSGQLPVYNVYKHLFHWGLLRSFRTYVGRRLPGGTMSSSPTCRRCCEDLSQNTPARRACLKTDARETTASIETVEALALAAPRVGFRLLLEGREALWAPAEPFPACAPNPGPPPRGAPLRRKRVRDRADHGRSRHDGGGSAAAHAQWFLVDGRPVRSRLLAQALGDAFHTLLPEYRQPAAASILRVPSEAVGVNVQPGKFEVRFVHERTLFADVVRWDPRFRRQGRRPTGAALWPSRARSGSRAAGRRGEAGDPAARTARPGVSPGRGRWRPNPRRPARRARARSVRAADAARHRISWPQL